MTKHVIELNGQKYDALTGNPVALTNKQAISGPKQLDGFVRRHPSPSRPATTVAHDVHKGTSKSQTLMRSGVKKPVSTKIHATTAAPVVSAAPAVHEPRLGSIKPGRVIRAGHVSKSNLIRKFSEGTPQLKNEIVAVKPAPIESRATPTTHSAHAAVTAAHSHTVAKANPFQTAVDQAVSHNQPRAKKPKVHHRVAKRLHVSPRLVSFVSVSVVTLAIGGVIAYQNFPELSMRIASAKSGLRAHLPGYQPAGFAMAGPIKYAPGEVTLNYKSHSDERSFDVVQRSSAWNSEALLENYVVPTKQPYQTFEAGGRTIYIYDSNKATWVDGGVWYHIDGKTNLNSDQLLRIASSL